MVRNVFIALKVVFVVRLPRVLTDVAEILSAPRRARVAVHKVAPHRPLNSLAAEGANLSVDHNPLDISVVLLNHDFPVLDFLA